MIIVVISHPPDQKRPFDSPLPILGREALADRRDDDLATVTEPTLAVTAAQVCVPEPYAGAGGAHAKDKIENALHRRVCSGAASLAAAHAEIVHWWTVTGP